MNWIFYAVGTAVILATADLLTKLAAGRLSNSLALLCFALSTLTISVTWITWERFHGLPQYAQATGIVGAIAVGTAFTFVTLGLYTTFAAGAPISLASPLIRLGGLLLASLAGLLLLGEPFTWRYVVGFILACGGIYLIINR